MDDGIKHLQRDMRVTEAVTPCLGQQLFLGKVKILVLEVWGKY